MCWGHPSQLPNGAEQLGGSRRAHRSYPSCLQDQSLRAPLPAQLILQEPSPCVRGGDAATDAATSAWGSSSLALWRGTGPDGPTPRQAGTAVVFRTKALFTSVQCCVLQMCSLVSPIKGFLVQYCIVPCKTIHTPTDIPGKLKLQPRLDKAEY